MPTKSLPWPVLGFRPYVPVEAHPGTFRRFWTDLETVERAGHGSGAA
jgi:hypothetical protein